MSIKHAVVTVIVVLAIVFLVHQSPFSGTFGLAS